MKQIIKTLKANSLNAAAVLLIAIAFIIFCLPSVASAIEKCDNENSSECITPLIIIGEDLGEGYSIDESFVYFKNNRIRNADSKSFKVLAGGYAKDNSKGFYYGREFIVVNISTFKYLEYNYAIDNSNIYYQGVNITENSGIDSDSFSLVSHDYRDYYIKDKNGVYCAKLVSFANPGGIIFIKNAEAESFEIVNNTYSKDAYRVFSNWYNTEIPGANPEFFDYNDLSAVKLLENKFNEITTDFIDNKDHPCATAYGDMMAKTNCYLKAAIESKNLDNCAGLGKSWYGPCINAVLENADIKDISFCDTASNLKARDHCKSSFEFVKTTEARKDIFDSSKSTDKSIDEYTRACEQIRDPHRCLLRLALDKKDKNICESIEYSKEKFNYFGISTSYKKACFLYFNPFLNIDRLLIIYFILAVILIAVIIILFNKKKRELKPFVHDLVLGLIFQLFVILFNVCPMRVFASSSFYPLRDYTGSFFNVLIKYYKGGGLSIIDMLISTALLRWWPVLFIIFPVLGYLWRKNKIIFWAILFVIIIAMLASVIIPIASMT